MQKLENVRNIYINNKKYSCCDWWQYDNDKKRGFLMVNYFAKDGIKKVRRFIKSGMIKNLDSVQ